jgi:hypothetical protein
MYKMSSGPSNIDTEIWYLSWVIIPDRIIQNNIKTKINVSHEMIIMRHLDTLKGLGLTQTDLISMTWFTKKYIKYLNFNEKIIF